MTSIFHICFKTYLEGHINPFMSIHVRSYDSTCGYLCSMAMIIRHFAGFLLQLIGILVQVQADIDLPGVHSFTNHFRYLKWRNPDLYKLYGYGLCKGKPTPKTAL